MKTMITNLTLIIILSTVGPAIAQTQTLDLSISHTIKTVGYQYYCAKNGLSMPCGPAFIPKCMSIAGNSATSGAAIVQFDCNGQPNENFIISLVTSMC